ncbi:PLP-dependent aminotransferase family protein [Taibaiella chishuiensis]|uniref:GntR family transcriptional regulator n=1 Tax=Taibaiella chishuiensis TaxID=1434707 RepID=A0A2P8D9X2_9BACT|nr:PLP-dependent aminotransferase family protein [Taibaiella chishuiensis]PSK93997.1 GntR family transcriptional regulator [Taibaiella chishuiensis]
MFPFENVIVLDKTSRQPVYRQIAHCLIQAIRSGTLKAGAHLPGSRELAQSLGVHRKTVLAAYEELDRQDWITIIPRKYTAVSDRIPLLKPRPWNQAARPPGYARDLALPFSTIAGNPAVADSVPGILIDDGHPDVRLSPIDHLLKTYRALTARKHRVKNAATGTAQGIQPLRDILAAYLSETRGLSLTADNLLITHGAQMSIYLAANLLLHPSSVMITGRPGYPAARQTFEATGAKVIEVPVDDNGIDTDAIEAVCKKKKVTAVYVIPHHHYPTTVTLSVERRMKLLELSGKYSFAIIEDDYDYDYHYTAAPYLPLASAAHDGQVIYTGSFSKMLDPSLRIGFMVAPANFIRQCTALRQLIDVGGDGYMQYALSILIREGELKRHLKKAKKCYHQRLNFLDTLLKARLGAYLDYTLPGGGMAIWIKLKPGYPVDRLLECPQLRLLGADRGQQAFRFGFAAMNEQELEQAVDLLHSILRTIKAPHKKGAARDRH